MLAADRDDLAGEVGRVVTGEEDDDAGDLPRLGRAPERLLAGQLGETPGQVLGKPLADAAPELLVLGADRTRDCPATDTRARRVVAGPRHHRVWPATRRRAYAQPTKHLLHWRPPGGADGPGCSHRRSGEVRRRASPRRAGRPAYRLPPATSSDHDRHTGTYRRGRNA